MSVALSLNEEVAIDIFLFNFYFSLNLLHFSLEIVMIIFIHNISRFLFSFNLIELHMPYAY